MQIDHANENGEVAFEDGAVVLADIILHCTGYFQNSNNLFILLRIIIHTFSIF